ncbi:MAG: 2-oxoacid:acceptor oxidoreductase family protein [Armatimonadota bacterium]
MELNIRIAGEAGQGIQTTGDLLVDAFASMGLWVFATQSYMSRIRGGLNWCDVRVADYRITSGGENADVLVALTEEAMATLAPEVVAGGILPLDRDEAKGAVAINFTRTALDERGSAVIANSAAGDLGRADFDGADLPQRPSQTSRAVSLRSRGGACRGDRTATTLRASRASGWCWRRGRWSGVTRADGAPPPVGASLRPPPPFRGKRRREGGRGNDNRAGPWGHRTARSET